MLLLFTIKVTPQPGVKRTAVIVFNTLENREVNFMKKKYQLVILNFTYSKSHTNSKCKSS